MKKASLIILFLLLLVAQVRANRLTLVITDSETGETVPARVLIKDDAGQSFYPPGAVTLAIGTEIWFISPGKSTVEISSVQVALQVERGKEYTRVKKELDFRDSGQITEEISLVRWIDMKGRGYLSGENHLHKPPDEVAAYAAAEDLDYASVLSWWKGPRFSIPENGGYVRDMQFGGITVPVSVYDVEVEDQWGATYLFGNRKPFPYEKDNDKPHLDAVKFGRAHGALVCYQAGWSREVLPDALLGYVDVVNVCNNNFHMHRYQPRSRYSNLLKVTGFPVYPDTPEGMMEMNSETYYRLLNCGLRLAAGAGSAIGAKETPAGYNRAYVRSKPEEGFEGYVEAWRAGKNFVTNGPMIFFRTADGLQPGDSMNVSDSQSMTFLLDVQSDSPIKTVEIVMNGEVIERFPLSYSAKSFSGAVSLYITESAWICARTTDTDTFLSDKEMENYRSPRKELYQDPCRLRYAHTSPIYIYKDGKEILVRKSVEEGLKMIRAFETYVFENAAEEYRKETLSAVKRAAEILKRKLEKVR